MSKKVSVVSNAYGVVSHPTDEYIHWSKKDPVAEMTKLRAAYDKIEAAGLLKELNVLTSAAWEAGNNDGYEDGHSSAS